jgi:hypothetical protein
MRKSAVWWSAVLAVLSGKMPDWMAQNPAHERRTTDVLSAVNSVDDVQMPAASVDVIEASSTR